MNIKNIRNDISRIFNDFPCHNVYRLYEKLIGNICTKVQKHWRYLHREIYKFSIYATSFSQFESSQMPLHKLHPIQQYFPSHNKGCMHMYIYIHFYRDSFSKRNKLYQLFFYPGYSMVICGAQDRWKSV